MFSSHVLSPRQVLSGASWGNLLLWDGSTIKVEICRKEGKSCHVGMSQPFALEDELVMTMGEDGVIRVTVFFFFSILLKWNQLQIKI